MKFGCCIPGGSFMPQGVSEVTPAASELLRQGYAVTKEAGYAYMEATVGLMMQLSEEETAQLVADTAAGRFALSYCNSFIPPRLTICDGTHSEELHRYIAAVFARMQAVGARLVVLGSGKARSVPEGMRPAEAQKNLDAFLLDCDREAGRFGVTVAIEPLNRRETNMILTVGEAAALVRRLGLTHVRVLADAFHMYCENEPFSALAEAKELLVHTHVAEPPERIRPGAAGGAYLTEFIRALQSIGYEGGVTVECGFRDWPGDALTSIAFLKGVLHG